MQEHRIKWWVYAGEERIARTSHMRGEWAYDATCSCGWDSRSGGGTKRYITEKIRSHKWDAAHA